MIRLIRCFVSKDILLLYEENNSNNCIKYEKLIVIRVD